MSDHEFEKQVQLKMEQLRLRPSDAVWTEVEKNIRRDKRRRRMIVWLPLLLLLLGAGGYFAMQETNHPAAQHLVHETTTSPTTSSSTQNEPSSTNNSTQQPQAATVPSTATTVPDQATTDNAANNPTNDKVTTGKTTPATAAIVPAETTTKPVTTKTVKTSGAKTSGRKITAGNNHQLTAGQPVRSPKPNRKKTDPPVAGKANQSLTSNRVPADNKNDVTAIQADSSVAVITDSDTAQITQDIAAITTPVATDSSLARVTPVDSAAKDTTAQMVAKAPVIPKQPKKISTAANNSKWQWGIQAEGGMSGVTKDGLFGFLEKQYTPVADLASPSFSNAITFAPQFPRPVYQPSTLKMGPTFSIGGFVQRTLSKRLSLSAGLQYTYLSARQEVGTKVQSNRTVNRAPATTQVVSEYYSGNHSHDYTNKYHFIELPLTLHTQLNKGKRLPIIWDAGFSVSKLLGTNALHYDGLGGVYYKDNALFNKTQWAVSTGFNLKLFQDSKHPLTVGPVMRYNMTNLLKKDFSTGQHLWAVGLRASVLLKK